MALTLHMRELLSFSYPALFLLVRPVKKDPILYPSLRCFMCGHWCKPLGKGCEVKATLKGWETKGCKFTLRFFTHIKCSS
jgi:hypothetical protein